jgi:predicted Zn-dependent protease
MATSVTNMNKKLLFLILSSFILSAWQTGLSGRRQLVFMPEKEINKMGLTSFAQLKKDKSISTSKKYNRYVTCIANPLIKEVGGKWEVVVFADKQLNAFALPGGKIGIYTGLIELVDNQSQLAAIVGHEIMHVLAQHGNERMSQKAAVLGSVALIQAAASPTTILGQKAVGLLGVGAEYGVLMPFSRVHESEADLLGLDLMAKAGFDPTQSIILWQKMAKASKGKTPEFLSTHPSHDTRIEDLQEQMPKALELQRQAIAKGKVPRCDEIS